MSSLEPENLTYPEALALRTFADCCSDALGEVQSAQTTGCPAANELAHYNATEQLDTAFSQGALLAAVAREQTEALARALTSPILTVAPWPITRNVLEASAIGAWLWEPTIGAQERVARSFAFRFVGLQQQVKVVRSCGRDIGDAEAKIDRLEQQGRELGYKVFHSDKGKISGVAKRMPCVTDLVKGALDAETDYRLLSAVVHGHAWALTQLGFEDSGPSKSQILGSRVREFRKAIPRVAITWACKVCGEALHKLHEHRARLFGVELGRLDLAFGQFQERISRGKA